MATSVSGPLRLVTDAPAALVQVLVRAPKPRPHDGGMLVDFTTPATVEDGTVSFPCVPGPAVLSVVNASVPQVTVPLVVPDKASATLEECIRAAELADTATRSELEDLAGRAVAAVSQAEVSASAAAESAAAAGRSETRAVAGAQSAGESARAASEAEVAAESWAGQSQDAATLAITAAATVSQYVGDGFPEGKIAAPVGSIYTDRQATAGAVRWIKTGGTGNTGWRVSDGDTGWRKIDGPGGEHLQEGEYLVRREGRRLWVVLNGAVLRSRNSNESLGRLPHLFRGASFALRFPVFVGLEPTPSLSGNISELGYVNIYGPKTDTPARGYACIVTDEAWPTSLPGVPV